MDRADNAAQSAKESVQEVHIFLFNLMLNKICNTLSVN